jgi:hypothetical protein
MDNNTPDATRAAKVGQDTIHHLVRTGPTIIAYRDLGGKTPFQAAYKHTFPSVGKAKAWMQNPQLDAPKN